MHAQMEEFQPSGSVMGVMGGMWRRRHSLVSVALSHARICAGFRRIPLQRDDVDLGGVCRVVVGVAKQMSHSVCEQHLPTTVIASFRLNIANQHGVRQRHVPLSGRRRLHVLRGQHQRAKPNTLMREIRLFDVRECG